ncbi:MAG: ABC transporter ATP-binding protein [Aeromicrobium sp.]|uniref:ABC transporter ATP-binding protein n=1 Tax=Aeromicrobium sp. TaxID=1871063 RepID=UPI0039E3C21C
MTGLHTAPDSVESPLQQAGTPALEAIGVHKAFAAPDGQAVRAVQGVDLKVERGSMTAIMGPSGSGKSTLLNLLAGLDRPDSGTIRLGDVDITRLRDRALTRLRRTHVGFVFQSFNLLPQLTARQNIVLPLQLARLPIDHDLLDELTGALGIANRLEHRPGQLSGGQQQRVAVVRALLPRPAIVVADEPTGALDSASGSELLGMLRQAVDTHRQSVLLVTHDHGIAAWADYRLTMSDGRLT